MRASRNIAPQLNRTCLVRLAVHISKLLLALRSHALRFHADAALKAGPGVSGHNDGPMLQRNPFDQAPRRQPTHTAGGVCIGACSSEQQCIAGEHARVSGQRARVQLAAR